MNIYYELDNIKFHKPIVSTIGFFDGVHKGHKRILSELIKISKENNCNSIVISFKTHPQIVLNTKPELKLITTNEEKINILEEFGIDNLILINFDLNFSKLSANDFIKKILVDKLNVNKVIVGDNHYFGKNREGNFKNLKDLSESYNIDVKTIDIKKQNQNNISSTQIRKMLLNGDIESANNALGYCFPISGLVTKGIGVGSKIGFPTANIIIENKNKIIPKNGVYFSKIIIENKSFFGMLNIGFRPTLHNNFGIEVHIFNFEQDIYLQKIKILIIKRLRDEQQFKSTYQLQEQLKKDKTTIQSYIKNLN